MSNREMLSEIINDEFFYNSVPLVVVTVSRDRGNVVINESPTVNIDVIIQNIENKDLINLGLGIYSDRENFSIFTDIVLDMVNASNFITYMGKKYKVIKRAPAQTYGFIEYVITQYNEEHLAGNGGGI